MPQDNQYSIIIPVYNELINIHSLLNSLKPFVIDKKNEIIIIDDGSDDGTELVLKGCSFINVITSVKNNGKGAALKRGLKAAQNDKIILFDGDMELDPIYIKKLMILNNKNNVRSVIGFRDNFITIYNPIWSIGNLILTTIFNIRNGSNHKDSLSCAKAFYKHDLDVENLKSNGFEIDVELASIITNNLHPTKTVLLPYVRRTKSEGKKLRLRDGWNILNCILKQS